MDSFKTSYILTKNELLFLLSSIRDVKPSHAVQYIINQFLSDSIASQDAVEGLVYKKLANKAYGKVVLEPVIDLLARSMLTSDSIWVIECDITPSPVVILKTEDMYLYVSCYTHISDAWKITPYQTKDALRGETNDLSILSVTLIDKNGTQRKLEACDQIFEEDGV